MALFGTKKKEDKKESKAVVRHARASKLSNGIAHEIIRAPWFSEKALIATEKGVYAFSVPAWATKAQIAGAVKEIFNVVPRKIRVVNLSAKRKALRTKRGFGTRAARRKAYVYLNAGDTIQFA
ncbi:50S ribosomal protein L23 [Candidatus Kaiserbacteria bacterium]|nr:50S ribosomal protein L23 [Candidatus Kaiserbacteria bacterium]